jgi:zinc protease
MRLNIATLGRRLMIVGFVVMAALSAPLRPQAAPGDVLPFNVTERTLPNGLKVIVVPTGFPNLVTIQIPVQTGSRNEVEPGKSGYANFFEHLMFRGTKETPPAKYREIMSRAGSRDNASTSDDRTIFYATFAKEHLNEVLGTYADMFQHLEYSEPDFKTEARAVLGEFNKNSASPLQKLFEVQRDHFYQVHTYKHTTMGFIADIENMPNEYQYSKEFFHRWYRPEYTTLIVAGDVTPDQVMALADKHWGAWKGGGPAPPTIPKEPAPKGPQYVHVPWPTDTLPYVTVAFPGPAFLETSKDTVAMALTSALYFGPTSELYKRLVVTEQRVDSFGAFERRSVAVHGHRAPEEPRRRRVRPRSDPGDDRRRANEHGSRRAAGRRESLRQVCLRAHTRQHRTDRHDRRGVCVLSPVV